MSVTVKTRDFLASDEAKVLRKELSRMMKDPNYNTPPTYSAAAKGDILFVDKHINYLSLHTDTNVAQYMSNLKLKTKFHQ